MQSKTQLANDLAGMTKAEVTAYMKAHGFTKFRSPCEPKHEASYSGTGFRPSRIGVEFNHLGKFTKVAAFV